MRYKTKRGRDVYRSERERAPVFLEGDRLKGQSREFRTLAKFSGDQNSANPLSTCMMR